MSVGVGATANDSFRADRYDVPVSSPTCGEADESTGPVFLVASVLLLALDATLRSPSPDVSASTAFA